MMNNEEFEYFYEKYYRISLRVAYRVVKDRNIAEDICQEVFSKLYEHPENIDTSNKKKLGSFVRRVTINHAKDYYKKAHVKREFSASDELPLKEREDLAHNVEAAILGMEENEYIKLILERLREKNRLSYEILIKVKYLDNSPDDVAREYGITRNNVNNRILRAKRWIETELSRLYED